MKVIKQMVHTALRDDTSLRSTLGHAATPYGVYEAHFPEIPDFTSLSYVTWQFLGGAPVDPEANGAEMRRLTATVAITAWSANPDTVEDAHKRVRRLLIDLFGVTRPTSDAEVHGMKLEDQGPDLFEDQHKVYYRAETYRIWYREDITA